MRLRVLTRSALVLLPLLVLAGRLHAPRKASPDGMTQEMNRCLTIVRVAATRRRGERSGRETPLTCVKPQTSTAAGMGPGGRLAKSA